jgi:phthalate 4,5-dioxygenase oxygenase subunit
MLTREENDLLCRVEGDAPMGQIFRRHWMPACLSEEVLEPDCDPVKVRLLGEDLVIFRDTDGRLGALGEYCSHRRASLLYGRNEDCGLRCLYHGWKFDVEGNVLEMSSEPPESGFVEKVKHKAYPAHEDAGLVWIYMGPRESMTDWEPPVFQPTPETKISVSKIVIDCNWAQILEGAIDSAHSSSLHSSDMLPARIATATATSQHWLRPSTDKAPRLQLQRTNWGFRYAALRRPISNAATHDYARITLFIAPYTVQIPPNDRYRVAILHVPMDDTHTNFYFIAWGEATVPDLEEWRKFLGAQVGVDLDERWRKVRTRENNYLQDRKAMKLGNFTGLRGIPNQDIAMWETMGPIADRSLERLGASDLAIVEFRKQMVEAAQTFAKDGIAIGRTEPHIPPSKLKSFEGIVPKATNWRTIGAAPEELEPAAESEQVA